MANNSRRSAVKPATIHDQKLERGTGGELHQIAAGDIPALTTAQGGPVSDDQNSLKIGERGPKLSNGSRAIAHTNFKLTWSRKYEPDGAGGCTLAAARPNLTIIYTLPEPAQKLPAQVQRQWAAFIAGMREHEKLHGVFIKEMVEAIEAYSVGLKVADDPGCKKIRQVLTKRLGELSQAQRQRSRDFDRAEMGEAGPIRRLILALVNGA